MIYTQPMLEELFNSFLYRFPDDPKPPIVKKFNYDPGEEKEISSVELQFAVAGFTEEDIKVTIKNRELAVTGSNMKKENLHAKFKCAFERKFPVSDEIDLEKTEVSLKNGILSIVLPVAPPSQNRTVVFGKYQLQS